MVRNQSANTTSLLALIACTVALILILYIQGALTRNYIGLHYLLADRYILGKPSGSQLWDAAMLELHPRLHLWLAQDAFDAGDLSQAETLLQPLLATPNNLMIEAERLLGRLWAQQGRWEDAVAVWRTSGDAHALVEAGLQAQADAQLVQALTAFEAADQVNPSVGKSQLATFLWRTMQEPEEAAALLRAGIDSQPDSNQRRQWLSQLGALYQDQQQWSQAIALYEALHQLMPNATTPLIQLGWSHYKAGDDVAVALAQFQLATSVAPGDGAGYLAIGQLLATEKEFDAADPWFARAVAQTPTKLSWQLAYIGNARDNGQLDAAIDRSQQALQALPNAHQLYFALSELWLANGQPARAAAPLMKALALAGEAAPASYQQQLEKIQSALGKP